MTLEIDWPDASAGAVDEAAARLREAGRLLRLRPREEVVAKLGQVLDAWRDPHSRPRRALSAGLPDATGFTRPVVEAGLDLALQDWTGEALREVVTRETGPIEAMGGVVAGFDTTSVLLAGSIPMPTLLAILLPLALRSAVLARPASRDLATARAVAASIAEVDDALGRCVEVVSFPSSDGLAMERFVASGCVMASGSDETLSDLRARIDPSRRLVGYGHRLSLAVVGGGATSGEALERACEGLALDVALWDQLGCLSPLAVFVEERDAKAAGRVARALAEALARISRELPRGDVVDQAAVAISGERAEAEMRAAAGQPVAVLGSGKDDWTVVLEDTAMWRAAPLHRFVRVHPVTERADLIAALQPLSRQLSAVAVAGLAGATPDGVANDLAWLGASRVCAPGRLQAPPLGWHHDGLPLLLPMARITDFELSR